MTTRDLIGVVLKDKWRVDARLGEGGVATVYAATHRNGKRVAVKVLHPHLASIPEVRDRFLREGYVANRVQHPGAVGVLDDDTTEDGFVFFVMDLLDGESLEKRLAREGRLPPAEVLAITDALLDVVAAAHAKTIIHRDIKPENVYLLKDGSLRLLDFGIARLHEQAAAKNATQSGAAMGTPSYMPPEQARGRWEQVDARSDLWAIGATMFALSTGRCVHEGETVNETLLQAMMQPAPPLASVWPAAPRAFAAVVDRALAFETRDRWPDAATMQQAVQEARLALGDAPVPRGRAFISSPGFGPQLTPPRIHMTPTGPRGTVLATTVSDRPNGGPRPRGPILGLTIGATLGVVVLAALLVVTHRGRASHGAPAPPTLDGVVATPPPLPSATLAPPSDPGPPTPSASASVAADAPAAPSPTTNVAPVAPRPSPRPSPSPTAAPPSHPTSNPLDRRH